MNVWTKADNSPGSHFLYKRTVDMVRHFLLFDIRTSIDEYVIYDSNPNNIMLDNSPGGMDKTQKYIADNAPTIDPLIDVDDHGRHYHCFVPTVSALDIKSSVHHNDWFYTINPSWEIAQNNTPFKAIYGSDKNTDHLEEILGELVNVINWEFTGSNLYVQNQIINVNRNYESMSISVGEAVAPAIYNMSIGPVVIGNNSIVTMRAGNSVSIEPGVTFEAGSNVSIYIDNVGNMLCTQGNDGARKAQSKMENASDDYEVNMDADSVIENASNVLIYPNPFSGKIQMKVLANEMSEDNIYVFDALGNKVNALVRMVEIGTYELDFGKEPSGMYHLIVKTSSGSTHKNLVLFR